MFVVCVTFSIKPEHLADFLPLMRAQAATSLVQEPGCHQFDICADPAAPNDIFLYEIYADEAAFRLHLESSHFKTFDTAVTRMVAGKDVRTWHRLT